MSHHISPISNDSFERMRQYQQQHTQEKLEKEFDYMATQVTCEWAGAVRKGRNKNLQTPKKYN